MGHKYIPSPAIYNTRQTQKIPENFQEVSIPLTHPNHTIVLIFIIVNIF